VADFANNTTTGRHIKAQGFEQAESSKSRVLDNSILQAETRKAVQLICGLLPVSFVRSMIDGTNHLIGDDQANDELASH
jgi:hypothetical protein